ncbi:PREDICTED: E3 ubiquitin-protein ligase RNF4-like [Habropoda laboriosa]|uniref:E3 ubiquitin-protein ligase RNF4-like n=1 Tax=Habropoda laboriosa TaxID=597456 RepID=UPI00083D6561|nr:PREDICTED: E3 ubiquitin-protein ligase RNF4-like [Habropoda laboriosa]
MSDPIDYIDLTIDSPVDKCLRLRNRNVENISNNNTRTKSRKRNSSKQQMQHSDSVIEISLENTCKDVQAMEIIDLDKTSPPEQTAISYVDDSTEANLLALICPICFEQLSSKMKPMSTRCGHIFCAQCLELALNTAKKCPTCKRAARLKFCTRLYF